MDILKIILYIFLFKDRENIYERRSTYVSRTASESFKYSERVKIFNSKLNYKS